MLAILLYTAAAGGLVIGARFVEPNTVLGSTHHRRLFWAGAAALVGLVGLAAGALVS